MGLFDRKPQIQQEQPEKIEKQKRLKQLQEQWEQYTSGFYDKGLRAILKDPTQKSGVVYYILDSENEYTCYPDMLGRGCTVYQPESYEEALSLPVLSISKSDYTLVFPKDNIEITEKNEFNQIWSTGDIHIAFVSDNKTIEFKVTNNQQNIELIKKTTDMDVYGSIDGLLTIPPDTAIVKLKKSEFIQNDGACLFWRNAGNLYITEEIQANFEKNKLSIITIPVNQIRYYKEEGSLRYEQIISGGGGGGANLGGAALGSFLFGGVGAIIGSNYGSQIAPITSETIEVDTRLIYLVFTNSAGKEYTITFEQDAIQAFEWFLPDKEYSHVIEKRRQDYEKELNA